MTAELPGIGALAAISPQDEQGWQRLAALIAQHGARAFSRCTKIGGHVTGSAFVLSPDATCVLLTHHRKLNRWLQLGGHCDGETDVRAVALKEAYEESGLGKIRFVSRQVFDIDIHAIPASLHDPEHLHYDVRYLLQATDWHIRVSRESFALHWVPLMDVAQMTDAPSIQRMADKVPACADLVKQR